MLPEIRTAIYNDILSAIRLDQNRDPQSFVLRIIAQSNGVITAYNRDSLGGSGA